MSVRDDLLARVDIVDVVGRYVQLRRTGKNRLGLCPFHKEKSPSFTVAEDKQIFKCFGCGKWGNAVGFMMEVERIDFRDAMKELSRLTNFDLTPYERNPEITEKRQQDREKLKLLNKRVQEFFTAQFENSPAASYVREKRKLTEETIRTFGIGYAPDSYVSLIDYLKWKGFTHEDMLQAWLVSQWSNGAMPFFRNRVTFPILDHIGNIVGFGGRALLPDQNPKYLNTTETPLYEKSQLLFGLDKARNQIRDHGFLIVVEGYMDVIALHQYGLPLGVATCGTALTADHLKLLKRHTEQVVLLFDNDSAWLDATIRALKVAYHADSYPRAFALPNGKKDVDEWLTDQWDLVTSTDFFAQSIDAFQFVMEKLATQTDLQNPVLRKKFQQQLFGILELMEDYGILMIYIEQMWAFLHLTAAEMTKEFKSRLKQQKRGLTNRASSESKPTHPEMIHLVIALHTDKYRRELIEHAEIEKLMDLYAQVCAIGAWVLTLPDISREEQLTLQLWWERQLEWIAFDKKHTIVASVVQKTIHDLIRQVLKDTSLTSDQKQTLVQMMR